MTVLQPVDSFFRENLKLSQDIGNRLAEGRAYGSLGNTHYLLGSFALAIDCHEKVS